MSEHGLPPEVAKQRMAELARLVQARKSGLGTHQPPNIVGGGGGLGPTHSYDEPWNPNVIQTSNGGGMGVGQPPVPDPSGVPQGSMGIPFQGGDNESTEPTPDSEVGVGEGNGLASRMAGRGPAFEAWANQFLKRNNQKKPQQGPSINNVGVRQ